MSRKLARQASKGGAEAAHQTPLPSATHATEPFNPLLRLQQAHGNRSVQRMLRGALIQRKCACSGKCSSCQSHRAQHAKDVAPIVLQRKSNGRPLESGVRAFMESRFGEDLSAVRVHTDAHAVQSARILRAVAYTTGHDIFFDSNRYLPQTHEGKRVLAHELTHVIQQRGGRNAVQGKLTISEPGDESEREAESVANKILSQPVRVSAGLVKAQPMIQRLCNAALGEPTPDCTTNTVDPTAEIFQYRRGCDDIMPSEPAHLTTYLAALARGTSLKIHGYASTFGGTVPFNWALSCHRANNLAARVRAAAPAFHIKNIYKHGQVAGTAAMREAAWIEAIPPKTTALVPTTPATPSCTAPTNPDLSGAAHNPTTSWQSTIALAHPLDAALANDAADDAFAVARPSGLAGPWLGPQDALRHCVWSCLMTQRIGAVRAEQFGTGHENSNPSAVAFDNQMDLHNNAMGRSLSTRGGDCTTACNAALASGRLRTVRQRPSVPADCIGASNQPWP